MHIFDLTEVAQFETNMADISNINLNYAMNGYLLLNEDETMFYDTLYTNWHWRMSTQQSKHQFTICFFIVPEY